MCGEPGSGIRAWITEIHPRAKYATHGVLSVSHSFLPLYLTNNVQVLEPYKTSRLHKIAEFELVVGKRVVVATHQERFTVRTNLHKKALAKAFPGCESLLIK